MFGETVDSMLAEDHVAIDDNVENTAGPLDECGVDIAVIFDCGGQTGRLGFIVSLHAVGDGDFHNWSISSLWNWSGLRRGEWVRL